MDAHPGDADGAAIVELDDRPVLPNGDAAPIATLLVDADERAGPDAGMDTRLFHSPQYLRVGHGWKPREIQPRIATASCTDLGQWFAGPK
jgi:hypothetical protein